LVSFDVIRARHSPRVTTDAYSSGKINKAILKGNPITSIVVHTHFWDRRTQKCILAVWRSIQRVNNNYNIASNEEPLQLANKVAIINIARTQNINACSRASAASQEREKSKGRDPWWACHAV
jgi:hypothetical protein